MQANCPDFKLLQTPIEDEFEKVLEFVTEELFITQSDKISKPRKSIEQNLRKERIEAALKDHGVGIEDLIPPDDTATPSLFRHFLPLSHFEKDSPDLFKPLECAIKRRISEGNSLPALGFLPVMSAGGLFTGEYDWQNVSAISYNENTRLWDVITLDVTRWPFSISNIYLIFEEDSIKECTIRLKMAIKHRNKAEARIRSAIIASYIPLNYLPEPKSSSVQKIVRRLNRENTVYKDEGKAKEEVVSWLKQLYAENIFISSLPMLWQKGLPFQTAKIEKCVKPRNVNLKIFRPAPNYAKNRATIQRIWLYPLGESYRAMVGVNAECHKLEESSFFNIASITRMHVDTFQTEIENSTTTTLKHLRQEWKENIVRHLSRQLKNLKKGWFWLEQGDTFIYDVSKLSKYMALVKVKMESALYELTLRSVRSVADVIVRLCKVYPITLHGKYEWGQDLRISNFIIPHRQPLFSIRMIIENGAIKYADPIEKFKETILQQIDFAVKASHEIQQVHPTILPNLRFPVLKLCSIGLLNPDIQSCKAKIEDSMEIATYILKSYLHAFQQFHDLALLDVKTFCANFSDGDFKGEDYKEEIEKQKRIGDVVDDAIPVQIPLGLFEVITDDVRSTLKRKQEELVERLKRMLFDRLRDDCMKVMLHFSDIEFRLLEKLSNIEDALEIENWISSLPLEIQSWDPHFKDIIVKHDVIQENRVIRVRDGDGCAGVFYRAFEILEGDFQYPFEDEFAKLYWTVRGLTGKIYKTIHHCQDRIKEDKGRFYDAFLQDEEKYRVACDELEDQIRIFMDNVGNLTNKVTLDVEAGKIWRALEVNFKVEVMLKSRAGIFEFETPIGSMIEKMMDEFKLYVPSSFLNQNE